MYESDWNEVARQRQKEERNIRDLLWTICVG
jgi:hypothetical protein